MSSDQNRRTFLTTAATTAAAFTIVPRHVLGGTNFVAPSDKLTVAYIGVGTQGIRELLPMLKNDDIQVVATCDPNRGSNNYVDWDKFGLRNDIREFLGNSNWRAGTEGTIPGGRDVAQISSRHTMPGSGPRASTRVAPPMPTCARCSTRRRASTPSRS